MPETDEPRVTPGTAPRIAVFVSFSGQGGVERMIVNLVGGMAARGFDIDLVLAKARGFDVDDLPAGVRTVRLASRHTMTSIPALSKYLRAARPVALLAAKDRAIKTAVMARRLAGVDVRLVGRLGTTVSAALADKGWLRRWIWYAGMRRFYRHVDHIVAVSEGVARDVASISRLPDNRVSVVRNPVVSARLFAQAQQPLDHPWFGPGEPPVVLAVGRLTEQKDFPTLVRAFARVRARTPCRLVIVGEGGARGEIRRLAAELDVGDDVDLPGFQGNPYRFMARSSLFVLSSAWEGSPNVLTEAMALGVPVVAADCPSGPREILRGGQVAPLVPVGDSHAMAKAMLDMLARPVAPDVLRGAVVEYTVENSASGYLAVLLPDR